MKIDLTRPSELDGGDFVLAPGDDGYVYLWWPTENTWIARFADRASAERILVGNRSGHDGNPGWPCGDVDVVAALYRHRELLGRFPQLEPASVLELLTRINPVLGLEFIIELIQIELIQIENGEAIFDHDVFHPIVAEYLAITTGLDATRIYADGFDGSAAVLQFTEALIRLARAEDTLATRNWLPGHSETVEAE